MIQDEHKIMGIALTRGNFRNFTILIQVIFWCFWSVLAYSSSPAQASPIGPTLYVLQKLPLMIAGVYFNYMVLIPHLLEKKRYLAYLLAAGGLIAGLIMLRYWVDTEINGMAADQLPDWQVPIFAITIVMIGSTLFKFAEAWFSITQQKTELQNQRLQAELKFLKTQVNPHFLFNTLNNLYSLALLKDDRAPQMIAKLSEIMRYLLSDTRVVHTKLSREMELFQSYVDLHQLQDDEAKNVDIYTEGIRNKHQIASLLLINFLENSFKHGDLNENPQGWIKVSTVVNESNVMHFSLSNSVSPYQSDSQTTDTGIGLSNARRQLELHYPKKHQLQIHADDGVFSVELEVDLSDPQDAPPISSQEQL